MAYLVMAYIVMAGQTVGRSITRRNTHHEGRRAEPGAKRMGLRGGRSEGSDRS